MKPTKLIINRQKASENRKYRGKLPEVATISIHSGGTIDYAYAVKLSGDWILQQNYDTSPCGGAHIWLESTPTSELEITHRRPLSETAVEATEDDSGTPDPSETDNSTPTPEIQSPAPKRKIAGLF